MSRSSFHLIQAACLLAIATSPLYSCSGSSGEAAAKREKPAKNESPPPKVAEEKKPEPEPKITFAKPEVVRGIYVTAWTASGSKKMNELLDLLDKTELNAMVIDVRDSGNMYWETDIPLAKHAPKTQVAIKNGKPIMEKLQKRGVYPIARIACFRDKYVPKAVPELGVKLPDGRPWADRSGHTWLDPYNKKNWEYVAQTVDFALDMGFPEIQLDYVRFPSEGKASTQRFPAKSSYPDPKALPKDVIAEFAKFIGERVRARGAVFSADIFGIISSAKSDQGIGQSLEEIAEPFDLVCPMVYPNHFARGEYGIADPNGSPYAIIKKSLSDYKKRIPGKPVRPWLQGFGGYGAAQLQAQMKAARELGYKEYLIWNAGNRYSSAHYPKEKAKATGTSAAKPKETAEPKSGGGQ